MKRADLSNLARENRRYERLATALVADASRRNDTAREDIADRYLAVGGAHVLVIRDADPNTFAARCEACGYVGSRAYTSTSPLGDFYDVREEVQQIAEDHAKECRHIPERLWPKAGA